MATWDGVTSGSDTVAYTEWKNMTAYIKTGSGYGPGQSIYYNGSALVGGSGFTFDGNTVFAKSSKTNYVFDSGSPTIAFNMSGGNIHQATILGSPNILVVSGTQPGQNFTLNLLQGGTGSNYVTWFSKILWPAGSIPTLSLSGGKMDVFTFMPISGGSFIGFTAGQFI